MYASQTTKRTPFVLNASSGRKALPICETGVVVLPSFAERYLSTGLFDGL